MSQNKFYRFFWVSCFFFVLAVTSFGQGVYEAWEKVYPVGLHYDYGIYFPRMALDNSGNIYIVGAAGEDGQDILGYRDYLLVKYTPDGDTAWVRRYSFLEDNFDQAMALALDDSGNIYVTGVSVGDTTSVPYNSDVATIKYSPDGDTIWVRRFNSPDNDYDWGSVIALDDSGNVYVAGNSTSLIFGSDGLLLKYNSNGVIQWDRLYDDSGGSLDAFNGIAIDDSGNIYVGGSSTNSLGNDFDLLVAKYNPNGNTIWVRQFAPYGPGNTDFFIGLALDPNDNIILAGEAYGLGLWDYYTRKISPQGDNLWAKFYDGGVGLGDFVRDLGVDKEGNIYVTGSTSTVGADNDFLTIKYAPNGDTLWQRFYNHFEEQALALAIDTSGNIYVTGLGTTDSGDGAYNTIKYSAAGESLWLREYYIPSLINDEAFPTDIVVDPEGNVYVTGLNTSNLILSTYDLVTVKYSPCLAIPGDVNASNTITLGDIVNLVNYVFDKDKLPCLGIDPGNCWKPLPLCRADVNASGGITLGDIVNLVNYIFDKDKLPCLGTDPGNCWTPVASGACCQPVP